MFLPAVLLTFWFADPPSKADYSPGKAMIREYFRLQVKQIQEQCLNDLTTREQWEKRRPILRQQLLEMLGLWPLPERTDLKPVVVGVSDFDKFTVERIYFQSFPGLYVTANLYVPKPAPKKAPTILYLCGHGNVVKDGISYGSKARYAYHPAWFAENGYVAMILDTLQLGEIQGVHHGTYRLGMWYWQALGYTPAGIECWNAMRALDYLGTRPEVDMQRVGVTGRSGGGAYSWWLLAADDRPSCFVPVAGIADLQAHLLEGEADKFKDGVITGHCDCMFMINKYRWDFAQVAAMCAPRPLLLGNTDKDDIFPVAGYQRIAEKVRKVYALYGASEKFALLEKQGPHKDTPELRAGINAWMNRWLRNDTTPLPPEMLTSIPPERIKVYDRPPADAINTTIHDTFRKAATIELPQTPEVAKEWWSGKKEQLRQSLLEECFRNWPSEANLPALNPQFAGEVVHEGVRLRAWDFTSEAGIALRLWLMSGDKVEKPSLCVLNVLDEAGFREWCDDLGPAFGKLLNRPGEWKRNDAKFAQNQRVLASTKWAFAAIAPRGIGPTRWADEGSAEETHIRRRFALIGQTLDGQRVWDVRRALATLRSVPELAKVPLWLQGKKIMAGIALYAALFEPDVARVDLWHLPANHREGPTFLYVLKVLDLPQAVALLLPRKVFIYCQDEAEAKAWDWPVRLQQALGGESLKIRMVRD